MTLYPRVTVTISFDTTLPLSSSFLVSNDGYLPVYSVQVSCLLGQIIGTGRPEKANREAPLGTELLLVGIPSITLNPGAKESVPFSDCISLSSDTLGSAYIGLRVKYRPLLWPRDRSFAQEFYAQKTENGRFFWYSVPYSK
jgi:hypothetical protein